MTRVAAQSSRTPKVEERGDEDAETRALWANPAFHSMLDRSRQSIVKQGTISLEELKRRRPLSELAESHAEAYLEALDRLEDEQGTEVTDDQGRILHLILTAAAYTRQRDSLVQLVEESGCAEAEIRAAAAALHILGLDTVSSSKG
jgi:PAS domain-containing protein